MRPSRRDILIATRPSPLARAQAEHVGRRLVELNPRVGMRLLPVQSEADRITDRPLAAFGGKGLFTRTVEQALLEKRADIAVHSLKDQPVRATRGLVTVATPPRLPVHDVLIAREAAAIADLPRSAAIGTCSPRRKAQLLRLRPDLRIVPLRGNVGTRIAKVLEQRALDATLLAAAGLVRLGLDRHAASIIPVDQVLPAAGQGALAIQCRGDDHVTMRRCMMLNDAITGMLITAERSIVAALEAECHSPLAVLAELIDDERVRLRVRVLSADGGQCLEADQTAAVRRLDELARDTAEDLIERGARRLLADAARAGASIPEP